MKNLTFLLLATLLGFACNTNTTTNSTTDTAMNTSTKIYPTTGEIERLHPNIDKLISKDATIEVLAEGFTWSEGPLWIEEGQYLLFSDIPPNRIMKWSEKEGISLYLHPSGYTGEKERAGESGSNALILNAAKQLVLCQHGDRRMARMSTSLSNPSPSFKTIINNFEGKRLNSPNDAVYDSKGNLYFTDPPYGLEKQMEDPTKELDFQGVFRYGVDGSMRLVTDQLSRPNGLAFSPDESKLYVANSDPNKAIWMEYTLDEVGAIVEEKLFYDATGKEGKGLPDGMKVDRQGNIWATGPGGVWVFQADGTVLGKIKTGEATSNCAFNADQSILYMTCDDYLMRIGLTIDH